MTDFLKTFVRGIVVTILLPVILAFLLLYTLYCTLVYAIMLIRNIVVFFMGGSITNIKADVEAKKVLAENNNVKTDMTQMLTDIMHSAIEQNPEAVQAMAQQEIATRRRGVNVKSVNEVREVHKIEKKDVIEGEVE